MTACLPVHGSQHPLALHKRIVWKLVLVGKVLSAVYETQLEIQYQIFTSLKNSTKKP